MNVLFLTYDFPFPTTTGGKNRAYHLLKHTTHSANIFLFSYVRGDYNPEFNNSLYTLGVKDIKVFRRKKIFDFSALPPILHGSSIFKSVYYDGEVLEILHQIVKSKKIDIIHCESSYMGYYINNFKNMSVKNVLGTENIEFTLYEDYLKFLNPFSLKQALRFMIKRFKNEELDMIRNANLITVVTKKEGERIYEMTGKNCGIVPNGIEPSTFAFTFDPKIKKNMLFVGNFTYFPNIDAVNFFYRKIFPKLSRDLTLTIVGKKCTQVFKFGDKRVIKKDFVEDIKEEYKNADFLIFPIRIGGGTNFKVLEAMSLGIPVVAIPERLEGLEVVDNVHYLGATDASSFKSQIERLYSERDLRQNIAKNARKIIEEKYNWEKIGEKLLSLWRGLR